MRGRPFPPGQSGNPGGRPRGFAETVRRLTGDGGELIKFGLGVLRDRRASLAVRLDAAKWLADRGWGKPVQPAELSGPGGVSLHDIHVAQEVHAMSVTDLQDFIRRMVAASQLSMGNGKSEAREGG